MFHKASSIPTQIVAGMERLTWLHFAQSIASFLVIGNLVVFAFILQGLDLLTRQPRKHVIGILPLATLAKLLQGQPTICVDIEIGGIGASARACS